MTIYTFGYGNRLTYDDLVNASRKNKIGYIVDVRRTTGAWSGIWRGPALSANAIKWGMGYQHYPELGNTSGTAKWQPPDRELADATIDLFVPFIKEYSVVLICAELDADRCHRSEVANVLSLKSGVPVTHIGRSP
jgi:Protein of unknown function, DUF488